MCYHEFKNVLIKSSELSYKTSEKGMYIPTKF